MAAKDNGTVLPDLGMAAMLLHRVRYFTDGAVIGSKAFVNEAFAAARARFGPRRKDGARKLGEPAMAGHFEIDPRAVAPGYALPLLHILDEAAHRQPGCGALASCALPDSLCSGLLTSVKWR